MNGQAKIDFEEWVFEKYQKSVIYLQGKIETELNALIIDFFDSVGIYIGIEVYGSPEFQIKYEGIVSTKSDDWYLQGQFSEIYSSRQQATEKSIEQAIILYNEKFKENEN